MNPASASPDPLPALGLSWGIKRSFIDYINSLPDGSVSATDGATVAGSSLFCFSPESSDYDVARGTGVLRFRGDVRLAGHHGMLLVRLLDPWITFTSGSGVLSISTGDGGGQDRTVVAFLSPSKPRARRRLPGLGTRRRRHLPGRVRTLRRPVCRRAADGSALHPGHQLGEPPWWIAAPGAPIRHRGVAAPGKRNRKSQPGDVAAQDKVGSARGTDAAGGNVVPASGARTAGRAVQGIGELPRQMPRRAEGPEAVKFLWREPSEYCGDIGHHGSLLADGA